MRPIMSTVAIGAPLLSAAAHAQVCGQEAKLLPDDGAAEDAFGTSAAISGTVDVSDLVAIVLGWSPC